MSGSNGDLRSWIELQSTQLRLADLNMLLDVYISNPDDNEVSMLTLGVLGESDVVNAFLKDLLVRRKVHFSGNNKNTTSTSSSMSSSSSSSSSTNSSKPKPSTTTSSTSSSSMKAPTVIIPDKYDGIKAPVEVPLASLLEPEPEPVPVDLEEPEKKSQFSETPDTRTADEIYGDDFYRKYNVKKKAASKKKNETVTTTTASHIRVPCGCNCKSHPFLTNCTICGRIHCEAEGYGPCLYCSSLLSKDKIQPDEVYVSSMYAATAAVGGYYMKKQEIMKHLDQGQIIIDNSAIRLNGVKGYDSTVSIPPVVSVNIETQETGLTQAKAFLKDMLDRAKTGQGTKILDEQADYYDFEGNTWLSAAERAEKERLKTKAEDAVEELRREYYLDIDEHGKIGHTSRLNDQALLGHGSVGAGAEEILHVAEAKVLEEDKKKQLQQHITIGGGVEADKDKQYTHSIKARILDTTGEKIDNANTSAPALNSQPVHPSVAEISVTKGTGASAVVDMDIGVNDGLHSRARQVYASMQNQLKTNTSTHTSSSKTARTRPHMSSKVQRSATDQVDSLGVDGFSTNSMVSTSTTQSNTTNNNNNIYLDPEEVEEQLAVQEQCTIGNRWKMNTVAQDIASYQDVYALATQQSSLSDSLREMVSTMLGPYAPPIYQSHGFGNKGDTGMCLSMHQPWASLLVYGIKRFEGRSWNTSFRGRQWIASTAHQTTPEEMAEVEEPYRALYPDKKMVWPTKYPASVLLGAVDMLDCFTAGKFEEYKNAYSKTVLIENNESSYTFVCVNPRTLQTPVSITGNHKLWNLPGNMHVGQATQLEPQNNDLNLYLPPVKPTKKK